MSRSVFRQLVQRLGAQGPCDIQLLIYGLFELNMTWSPINLHGQNQYWGAIADKKHKFFLFIKFHQNSKNKSQILGKYTLNIVVWFININIKKPKNKYSMYIFPGFAFLLLNASFICWFCWFIFCCIEFEAILFGCVAIQESGCFVFWVRYKSLWDAV